MLSGFWKKSDDKKKRSRVRLEEDTNRDGHWFRDFSVRQESWPAIESWASEFGYRLVAMKGKRRLYQKGDEESLYQTFVDFRHEENRLVVSSWITTNFKMRLMTLFLVPEVLLVDPQKSWKGIRVRRDTCRDLNGLLSRFRQPEILGSLGFHITDTDLSTLFLSAFLIIPVHAFLVASLWKLQVRAGLSNALLMQVGNKAQTLLIAAILCVVLHHFGVIRFFKAAWAKSTSVAVFTVLFSVLAIFVGTRTRSEMQISRVVHHCVMYLDEGACAAELKGMNPKDREALMKQVVSFHHQLATRTDQVYGPAFK